MSKEDKNAVLMAARKLKKTNRKPEDFDDSDEAVRKNRKNADDDEGIIDGILNAVSKFRGRD